MSRGRYVGIDAGSSATKCVVLDVAGDMLGQAVVPSGFDYAEAAAEALARAMAGVPLARRTVAYCVSTGYGRKNVRGADRQVTEITCHARGARQWYPQVRGIVDIGGQDTKVVWIDGRGELIDYRMNSKCAAGTGTFLESVAVRLGLPLTAIDELAMTSTARTVLNSYCTVFTGTEVIERIKAGEPRQDISMGLFRSIAARVFEMSAVRDGPLAATGGVVAHCRAMVRALEEIFGAPLLLPPLPQLAGAYGAALLAMELAGAEPVRAAERTADALGAAIPTEVRV
ncbi:MAG: ATPase [Phycisphaerae bacterium]|nr:acyl-CoA dehydratase activase [Phycisphaerae bacterium]NUQ45840.1 ATPase [Phycisphaerae bacterium]